MLSVDVMVSVTKALFRMSLSTATVHWPDLSAGVGIIQICWLWINRQNAE